MFDPGDVIAFWSERAEKRKYHLCISLSGHYIFLNSPKSKAYPGDLIVDCIEFPFLTPTPEGFTNISCTVVMQMSSADLKRHRARRLGAVSHDLLRRILHFVENSPVVPDRTRQEILDGLADWI